LSELEEKIKQRLAPARVTSNVNQISPPKLKREIIEDHEMLSLVHPKPKRLTNRQSPLRNLSPVENST
jgi:hypothetical protein